AAWRQLRYSGRRRSGRIFLTAGGADDGLPAGPWHQVQGASAHDRAHGAAEQALLPRGEQAAGRAHPQDVPTDWTQRQIQPTVGPVDGGHAQAGGQHDVVRLELLGGGDGLVFDRHRWALLRVRAAEEVDHGGRQQAGVDLPVALDQDATGERAGQGGLLTAGLGRQQVLDRRPGGALNAGEILQGREVRAVAADHHGRVVAVPGGQLATGGE